MSDDIKYLKKEIERLSKFEIIINKAQIGTTIWQATPEDPENLKLIYANKQAFKELSIDPSLVGMTLKEAFPVCLSAQNGAEMPIVWHDVVPSRRCQLLETAMCSVGKKSKGKCTIYCLPIKENMVAVLCVNIAGAPKDIGANLSLLEEAVNNLKEMANERF